VQWQWPRSLAVATTRKPKSSFAFCGQQINDQR
jgi:hypothetical protein